MTNAELADWLHSWRDSLKCEAPCEAAVCLCNERVVQIIAALRSRESGFAQAADYDTDAKLADQIERWLADDPDHMGLHSLSEAQWRGIVAALRHQPSVFDAPLCAGHADWWYTSRNHLKGDTACVVCAFNPERQPSRDQVLVPKDIGELAQDVVATMNRQPGYKLAITHGRILKIAQEICRLYELSKLAAAEAEGRQVR